MKEERKKKFRSPKPGRRPNPMKEERKKTKRNPGGEDRTSERRKQKKKKKSQKVQLSYDYWVPMYV